MLKDVGRLGLGSHAHERSRSRAAKGLAARCGAGWRGRTWPEEMEREMRLY